jgi:preprotein translocase subunit YajC
MYLFLIENMALAQGAIPAAGPAQPAFSEVIMRMAPMFLVVFLVFHFMVIKPQKKKEQDHQALITGLKVGDNVITSSGIIGKVTQAATDYVTLEISSGVKVKFLASHIAKKEDN